MTHAFNSLTARPLSRRKKGQGEGGLIAIARHPSDLRSVDLSC